MIISAFVSYEDKAVPTTLAYSLKLADHSKCKGGERSVSTPTQLFHTVIVRFNMAIAKTRSPRHTALQSYGALGNTQSLSDIFGYFAEV